MAALLDRNNLDELLELQIDMIDGMDGSITDTDFYKGSHFKQYPDNTAYVSSYIEARGGAFNDAVFFGLQAYITDYLSRPITREQVDYAEEVFTSNNVPFNREGWDYIIDTYDGYLPLEIKAMEEGTVAPIKNAMVQVQNTDPKCFWLTSYVETALLRAVWYPTTVATLSREVKKTAAGYLNETSDTMDKLDYMLNDFGARGVSSKESAKLGGMAHLVNFSGTDTVSGILAARQYYAGTPSGGSVPASEHSTMTSWGRTRESKAYSNMLKQFDAPGALISVVSDSYDFWNAVDNIWGEELKDQVLALKGTLVIRPDSGKPIDVIALALEKLDKAFGSTVNSKGYKVLNDKVRLIQADGVNIDSIGEILERMKQMGYSADNIVFGMGGGLLQSVNRDTMKFAMKASAANVDGEWIDVYKDPITDSGKRSKRGRLAVIEEDGVIKTVRKENAPKGGDLLKTFYRVDKAGMAVRNDNFDAIRKRAAVKKSEYKLAA